MLTDKQMKRQKINYLVQKWKENMRRNVARWSKLGLNGKVTSTQSMYAIQASNKVFTPVIR